ncbi:MAG: hypothetical protein AB7I50_07265 [Vicinamibacterales bacterium]
MLRHNGGEHVKSGFYFNIESWEITPVSGHEGATLSGDARTGYLRIPVLVVLLLAPVLGALLAMFLPFIGLYLVAQHFGARTWAHLKAGAHAVLAATGPAWQPGTAHLTGTSEPSAPPAKNGPSSAEARLSELERKIEEESPKR